MRRRPLAAMLALLSAALLLGGNALLDAGWGSALRSIADRVLPNPEIAMWAPALGPGSHASFYADATGVSVNLIFTSFTNQTRRSRKGGFTACANVFSPIPVTP